VNDDRRVREGTCRGRPQGSSVDGVVARRSTSRKPPASSSTPPSVSGLSATTWGRQRLRPASTPGSPLAHGRHPDDPPMTRQMTPTRSMRVLASALSRPARPDGAPRRDDSFERWGELRRRRFRRPASGARLGVAARPPAPALSPTVAQGGGRPEPRAGHQLPAQGGEASTIAKPGGLGGSPGRRGVKASRISRRASWACCCHCPRRAGRRTARRTARSARANGRLPAWHPTCSHLWRHVLTRRGGNITAGRRSPLPHLLLLLGASQSESRRSAPSTPSTTITKPRSIGGAGQTVPKHVAGPARSASKIREDQTEAPLKGFISLGVASSERR
jgi:hypothetical protein